MILEPSWGSVRVLASKFVLGGRFGRSWRRLGNDLGLSWGILEPLGSILGRLEASWSGFGVVLERFGSVLGGLWTLLEPLGGILDASWSFLKPKRCTAWKCLFSNETLRLFVMAIVWRSIGIPTEREIWARSAGIPIEH